MAYEISWEGLGVYKKFTGFVTVEEFMASIAKLHGDPRFDQARYSINDFSAVAGHSIGTTDVKKFAGFALGAFKINPRIKIAVISEDAGIVGLVNLFAVQGIASYPLRLFSDIATARAWLAA